MTSKSKWPEPPGKFTDKSGMPKPFRPVATMDTENLVAEAPTPKGPKRKPPQAGAIAAHADGQLKKKLKLSVSDAYAVANKATADAEAAAAEAKEKQDRVEEAASAARKEKAEAEAAGEARDKVYRSMVAEVEAARGLELWYV